MKTIKGSHPKNLLLGVSIILTIFVFMCSTSIAQTEKIPRGGTLKIAFMEPPHFNPALTNGPPTGIPACQLFAGLLQFDEKSQPRPYLAKKWETSSDGLSYTFSLERGATFHDGKPITSADVAFSLEIAKKNHPFAEQAFSEVDKIETPDSYTAVFRLKRPSPVCLAAAHPWILPILPKHIYSEGDIRKHPANMNPTVGSGPFRFVEWKRGQYIILERYENFFRQGKPYLDRIMIEFITDATARTIALETGATHIIPFAYTPYSDIGRLEKMEHLAMTTKGFEAIGPRSVIEINLRKPPLNNIKVRKAIAHCLDRDFTIENISMGFAKPAIAPLRYTNQFCNPNLQSYEFNLSKANQLLDEAGYKRGADGIRFNLSIDFIPGGGPTTQAGCEFLREQLKKVGINLSLRPPPDWATWVTRLSNWDFELNSTAPGDQLDPAIGIDRSFTSKNIKNVAFTNTMGYSNPEVDHLCDEARKELNFEKRKKLYHRLQEILWDELPVIWNTDAEWTTLYNKDFVGLPMDKFGLLNPLDTVYWRKGKVGP